ncbi:hypothetical protein [Streptomyces palmae]|uniref:Uncharacterized protein n=1 Tax=Streptomyces palmae TaxID=1701085 RepID=A0A4Z0GVG2_9ACTN|nr:hypothetical protein [Streptomyces palmae]TGB01561.1 hypothetical protein E4099_21000 [Streptomyces palmae]
MSTLMISRPTCGLYEDMEEEDYGMGPTEGPEPGDALIALPPYMLRESMTAPAPTGRAPRILVGAPAQPGARARCKTCGRNFEDCGCGQGSTAHAYTDKDLDDLNQGLEKPYDGDDDEVSSALPPTGT